MRRCCPLGNIIVRLSHVSGWLLIRLLHVFEKIHCVAANLVVFWLGSYPVRCLLCCLLDGETQIWLGDLRLALCFCLFFGCGDLPSCM